MIDKALRYLKKQAQWRRYAKRLREFTNIEDYQRFLEATEYAPLLAMWRSLLQRHQTEAELVLDTYRIETNGKRVLDVGAGSGGFLDAAGQRGAVTVGLDYNPLVVRWLQLRGHLAFAANILRKNWSVGGNMFDLVHLKGSIVVEYFDLVGYGRLGRFLANLENCAAPGGRILLCPYFELAGSSQDRVLRTADPLNCRFTSAMRGAGYEIMERIPLRNDETPYPLTYGKSV